MKISDLQAPAHINLYDFSDREEAAAAVADLTQQQLAQALKQSKCASLAVSGGSTPIPLFKALSKVELDWQQVCLTLVDDRWLSPENEDSNQRLVTKLLLTHHAQAAQFISFWQPDMSPTAALAESQRQLSALTEPLTTVILGMGNDGHTASIFPCAPELEQVLNSRQDCALVTPTTAPYTRLTLTPQRLLHSQLRVLHICGADKLKTLKQALSGNDIREMPIRLFLEQPLSIFWSP